VPPNTNTNVPANSAPKLDDQRIDHLRRDVPPDLIVAVAPHLGGGCPEVRGPAILIARQAAAASQRARRGGDEEPRRTDTSRPQGIVIRVTLAGER
jgi:hypothetical protein